MLPNAVELSPLFPANAAQSLSKQPCCHKAGLCWSNILPLFQDMLGDARGMRSMPGLKSVPQVPQAAVCWWPTLLLYDLEDSFLHMTLTGLAFWLLKIKGWNLEILFSVKEGFFPCSPPQHRGCRNCLIPRPSGFQMPREKVCVVVGTIFPLSIRMRVRYWWGWAALSNRHMPKALE